MPTRSNRLEEMQLIDEVDALNEQVRVLALNLAIYLARAKGRSKQLHQLEPDFIRLVNGAVKVVRELALIIEAARRQTPVPDASSQSLHHDEIEIKLQSILAQCGKIMKSLSITGNFTG